MVENGHISRFLSFRFVCSHTSLFQGGGCHGQSKVISTLSSINTIFKPFLFSPRTPFLNTAVEFYNCSKIVLILCSLFFVCFDVSAAGQFVSCVNILICVLLLLLYLKQINQPDNRVPSPLFKIIFFLSSHFPRLMVCFTALPHHARIPNT